MLLGLLFAFPLNVNAADGTDIISITDMNIYADETIDTTPSVDGGVVTEDTTNELNIKKLTSGSLSGYTQIDFPGTGFTSDEKRLFVTISLTDFIKLNSEHEYSLSFNWVYNVELTASMYCALRFYDNSGNLLKEQILVSQAGTGSSKNHLIDVSFVPDTQDITSGYKCELFIGFLQSGYNSNNVQRLYISDISLIDNDDDSGWFQKILNKINDVWESIKVLPDKIEASFSAVGDGIVNGIREALQWAFVPSEEYLDGFADSWQSWFESHFGVFSQVTNFLVDMIGEFEDLFTGNYAFVFPEVSVPIMDKNIVLIEKQTVDVAQWLEAGSFGARLYEIYTTCVWAIIIYCVMKYALVVQDIIFSGTRMVLNEI